jgi:hypothetical protein
MPLDLFKVPEAQAIRMSEDALRGMTEAIFEKLGVPRDDAVLAADVLVALPGCGQSRSRTCRKRCRISQSSNPADLKIVRERASTPHRCRSMIESSSPEGDGVATQGEANGDRRRDHRNATHGHGLTMRC